MSEESGIKKNKINWSPDRVMSTSALFVSLVSVIALFYQLNLAREENALIRKQQSASVLPYLSFSPSLGPQNYRMTFVNQGVGPAFIKEVEFTVNGTVKFERSDFFFNYISEKILEADGVEVRLATFSFMDGNVLPANDALDILTLKNEAGISLFRNYLASIEWGFSIIYEDVYGARWKLDSENRLPTSISNKE